MKFSFICFAVTLASRYLEAGIRVLARLEDPAAWQFIEKVACDHPHEFSELASMFVKRRKSGRPQPEWSKR